MILIHAFKNETYGKAIVLVLKKHGEYHVDVQYCTNEWSPAVYVREKSDANLGMIENHLQGKYQEQLEEIL